MAPLEALGRAEDNMEEGNYGGRDQSPVKDDLAARYGRASGAGRAAYKDPYGCRVSTTGKDAPKPLPIQLNARSSVL